MKRPLRDHPALAGTTVTLEWLFARWQRSEYLRDKQRNYPKQVQAWKRACAALKGSKKRPPQPPLTPFEYERSQNVTPLYPLNYLVQ